MRYFHNGQLVEATAGNTWHELQQSKVTLATMLADLFNFNRNLLTEEGWNETTTKLMDIQNLDDLEAFLAEMGDDEIILRDCVSGGYFMALMTNYDECYETFADYESNDYKIVVNPQERANNRKIFYCTHCEVYFRHLSDRYTTGDGFTVHVDAAEQLYYCDYLDTYYLHEDNIPEPEETENYLDSYHSDSSGYLELDEEIETLFYVGFEAEKEDLSIRNYCSIYDFKEATDHMWRKEADSSLNDTTGFELISPYMKLAPDAIRDHIKSNRMIQRHVNAMTSKACGGHVHLSKENTSGRDLYDSISGYFPILLSMYRNRIENSYSRAGSKDDMKSGSRMAIHTKQDRIEIRVFSAIKNVEQLHFRLRLLEFICNNPTDEYKKAVSKIRKEYKNIFEAIYTREQFNQMLNRSEVYSIDYQFSTSNETQEA